VRVGVLREGIAEAALLAGVGEIVDERGGGDEAGIEAVLDGAVSDRHGEVRLPAAGLAVEDEVAAFGDEVGAEVRAEHREP
jgi:hypothetical protein